jgi:hypothetical protein
MNFHQLMRGMSAAVTSLASDWDPRRLYKASDEQFVRMATDRQRRGELIASLSTQRLRLTGALIFLLAVFLFMLIVVTSYPSDPGYRLIPLGLVVFVLLSLEGNRQTIDTRIKFLKLYESRSEPSTGDIAPGAQLPPKDH